MVTASTLKRNKRKVAGKTSISAGTACLRCQHSEERRGKRGRERGPWRVNYDNLKFNYVSHPVHRPDPVPFLSPTPLSQEPTHPVPCSQTEQLSVHSVRSLLLEAPSASFSRRYPIVIEAPSMPWLRHQQTSPQGRTAGILLIYPAKGDAGNTYLAFHAFHLLFAF